MSVTSAVSPTTVVSPDGTTIAAFVSGHGRPLVVVHGATSDHTSWRLAQQYLERHATVYAVDRRGRGDSGDGQRYSLAAECADVAAVVDAASATGGPVDLLGHSYGGNIAFGAAGLTTNIRKLVLYEGWPAPDVADRTTPPELLRQLDTMLAQGRREELLVTVLREVALLTDAEITTLRSAPSWPSRVAAAGTMPRELRAFAASPFDAEQAGRIRVPVLLLVGADSPASVQADPEVVAAAMPDARIEMLAGQAHVAHLTAPELLAERVREFLDR